MYHKIKPIIGKGTLDFPNNWGRVKRRLGFGSFNIHLHTSLKALRIDTDLIYHAACLENSKCFVCGDWFIPKNGRKILYFLQFTQFWNAKRNKNLKSAWAPNLFTLLCFSFPAEWPPLLEQSTSDPRPWVFGIWRLSTDQQQPSRSLKMPGGWSPLLSWMMAWHHFKQVLFVPE